MVAALALEHIVKHASRVLKRIAHLKGRDKIEELLSCAYIRRIIEVLRMPLDAFEALVLFCHEHTLLQGS